MGFVPGAYICVCNIGYYFPRKTSDVKAYTGEEIEDHFRQKGEIESGMFRCVECAAGCDTCVDDSPCLHQRNKALLYSLIVLDLVTVAGIICIAIITYLYRIELVSLKHMKLTLTIIIYFLFIYFFWKRVWQRGFSSTTACFTLINPME